MRYGRASDSAATMLVAGLVTCLAGCVTDSEILKRQYGEGGAPIVATRAFPGAGRAVGRRATVDARAGWSRALSFACNTWREKGAGERLDYPADFVGIGNRFTTADQVAFGLKTGITRAYKRTFRLWDQTKTLVHEKEKDVEPSDAGHVYARRFEPGDLEPGAYEAAWSIDGEEVCSTKIVIVGQ
ncbi:MAG: hypothetical protein ACYS9X_21180 [Planctomycetota bacterium]